MAILSGLERGIQAFERLRAIPEQQRTERQRLAMNRLLQSTQDLQERASTAATNRQNADIQLTRSLVPDIEAGKQNDFNRSQMADRATTNDVIQVTQAAGGVSGDLTDRQGRNTVNSINAQYDGAGNLVRTQGGVNLTAQESQQEAAMRMLGMTQEQELKAMGMTYGDRALVPQILDTTRGLQSERLGFMREMAQMSQPNSFERAVGAVGPLAVLLASTLKS
jgi:hypothetical protein